MNKAMVVQPLRGISEGVDQCSSALYSRWTRFLDQPIANVQIERHRIRNAGADQKGADQESRTTFFPVSNGLRSIQAPGPQADQILKLPARFTAAKKGSAEKPAPKLAKAVHPISFDVDR